MPNKEVKYKFSSTNLACLAVVLLCLVNQALDLIPTHFCGKNNTLGFVYGHVICFNSKISDFYKEQKVKTEHKIKYQAYEINYS